MYGLSFWKDAIERIIASFAGGLLSVWGGNSIPFFDLDIASPDAFKIAAGTALVSLLKAIVAAHVGNKRTASLTV